VPAKFGQQTRATPTREEADIVAARPGVEHIRNWDHSRCIFFVTVFCFLLAFPFFRIVICWLGFNTIHGHIAVTRWY
jgi:hypothetical protein